jgi:hypothetical protein
MPPSASAGQPRGSIVASEGHWLPDPNNPRILGLDISKWNGTFRFDVTAEWNDITTPKVEYFMIRSGLFDDQKDSQFVRNMEKSKLYGFPRGIYHVIGPARDPILQAEHLLRLLDETGLPDGPIAIDVELVHGQTPITISDKTYRMWRHLRDRVGDTNKPIIYSGKWFTDQYMLYQDWMNNVDWWLAIYANGYEHPGIGASGMPYIVPLDQCITHQSGAKADGRLLGGGLDGTKDMDTNRWYRSREEFNTLFNQITAPPPPPPNGDLEIRVGVIEDKLNNMRDVL